MRSGQYGKGKFYPRKASFAPFLVVFCLFLAMLIPSETGAWTLSDLNPWKQIREYRIFLIDPGQSDRCKDHGGSGDR